MFVDHLIQVDDHRFYLQQTNTTIQALSFQQDIYSLCFKVSSCLQVSSNTVDTGVASFSLASSDLKLLTFYLAFICYHIPPPIQTYIIIELNPNVQQRHYK